MALSNRSPLLVAAAIVCLACSDDPAGTRTFSGVSIAVSPDSLTLAVGATTTLRAVVSDLEGRELPDRQVEWSSAAPGVVSVSPQGVVTALSPGRGNVAAYHELGVGFAHVVVQLDFRRPVGGGAILMTEIGSPTTVCPGGEGGVRESGGRDCSHAGISRYSLDFRAPGDLPGSANVLAAADGVVADICLQPSPETTCGPHGSFVYVEHGFGFASLYSHLDPASVTLRRKTAVTQGQPLGRMSSSGPQSYPWTHFELRYGNQDQPQRRVLDGLLVGGRKLAEFRVGE